MRIKLALQPERYPAVFPLDNHLWAAAIYQALRTADASYADFLHGSGYRNPTGSHATKGLKPFVFARPYVPNMAIRGEQLWCHGGIVQWQIGSPIAPFLTTLEQGLRAQGGLEVGATRLVLTQLERLAPPDFTSPMRFTALSPLMVDGTPAGAKNKHFVRAGDERFAALIATNLREKHRILFGTEATATPFHFAFDAEYVAQRGGLERCSKLAHYKGLHIKSYLAPFVVQGGLELIQLGWAGGFGNGNSQGFGMAGGA